MVIQVIWQQVQPDDLENLTGLIAFAKDLLFVSKLAKPVLQPLLDRQPRRQASVGTVLPRRPR